ncbi:MAG: hypothetical protein JO337_01435 [Acidimicrobiales bacterium]|nr:hypothetical protein [Acidimicrobiales bacterium]
MTEAPKPVTSALDLFVYAPVGLVVTAVEELPMLVAKGRERIEAQVTMARLVGQFAVAQGRQQLERRWNQAASPSPPPADPDVSSEDSTALDDRSDLSPATRPVPTGESPRSAELAIPGYDSLSASQVVQRLAGLSESELSAVGAYEQAGRARRTILNRISQLQGR